MRRDLLSFFLFDWAALERQVWCVMVGLDRTVRFLLLSTSTVVLASRPTAKQHTYSDLFFLSSFPDDIIMGRLGGSSVDTTGQMASSSTRRCVITKICVRDLAKPRSFHVDEDKTTLVSDVNSILDDDNIDIGT